jgi:hypothetical protein
MDREHVTALATMDLVMNTVTYRGGEGGGLKPKCLHGAGKNIHDSTKRLSHETEFSLF